VHSFGAVFARSTSVLIHALGLALAAADAGHVWWTVNNRDAKGDPDRVEEPVADREC
jgi:hypothetical protein